MVKVNSLLDYLLLGVFLLILSLGAGSDGFFNQRAGLFFLLGALSACFFVKKYGLLVGGFFGYCLESALYSALWRSNHFSGMGQNMIPLHRAVLIGTLSAALSWFVVSLEVVSRERLSRWLLAFGLLACGLWAFPTGFFAYENILMTPTVMASFLILLLPIAFRMKEISLSLMFGLVIAMAGGYTAVAAMGALICAYLSFSIGLWAFLPVGGAVTGFGLYVLMGHWSVDHWYQKGYSRIAVWGQVWRWFWEQPFHFRGMGAGTAYQLVPWVQLSADKNSLETGIYTYLHNEPLQVLFELGLIGLIWVGLIYIRSLVRCYRSGQMHDFAFLCALGVVSLTMMPFRQDTFALMVIFQLHWILKKPSITHR